MASTTAQSLLERFWDLKVPVDPEVFAKGLGLTVELSDDLGLASGFLDVENKKICVNKNECPERRRFTIAHELGHFCLGHCSSFRDTSDPMWYAKGDPAKELQANSFAAELIMPAIAIKILVDKRGIKNAAQLRQMLGVSSQALNRRLRSLGYFL